MTPAGTDGDGAVPEASEAADQSGLSARDLLRVRAIWIAPAMLGSVLVALMALIYIGSVVNPSGHLRGLPVLVVNEDQGWPGSRPAPAVGAQIAAALDHSPQLTSRLSLRVSTLSQAKARMDADADYLAIVIPSGLSSAVADLYATGSSPSAGLPTIELLTNPRAGSLGVSLATAAAQPAIVAVGAQLRAELGRPVRSTTPTSAAVTALRASPLTVLAVQYRPLPAHSALGLSAFYVSLLALMCGFLGGTIVNSSVDSALGFAPTEVGPKWRFRRPVQITRWHTLLTKWAVAAVLAPVLDGVMLIVAAAILRMDTPRPWYLWLFTSFAAIVVALGTLVLFAAFGSLGQLLAMLVFVYLALASSGGTVPLQALPGVLKFVANFEPLARQILGGVRSILYFGSAGDAGLTRGFVLTTIGLVFWLVAGFAVTQYYDWRGLTRMEPELLAYVNRSAREYGEQHRPA